MLADLSKAESQIRALARAIGWERRQVKDALEAYASIEQAEHVPVVREVVRAPVVARAVVPAPKTLPKRSEPYRRWVASLRCAHCHTQGHSQCAHGDEGKGLGIKSSDETCFPACADGPNHVGCHTLMGATGKIPRADRRRLERAYAAETQRMARESGNWPKEWD